MKKLFKIVLFVLLPVGFISLFFIKNEVKESSINYTEVMHIKKIEDLSPLEYGFTFLGQKEKFTDGRSNPIILDLYKDFADWITDTEVPWCSAYINSVYASTGRQYSGKLNARSWLDVGEKIDDPKPGDLVIFWRESPSSWKGHVAIYLNHKPDNKYISVLGGNQNNEVNVSDYLANRVIGYRRPKIIANAAFETSEIDTMSLKLEEYEIPTEK